jgi:alpha-galactosidase
VDENLVLAVGRAFVSLGLKQVGWQVVVVDDGWQVGRNASGFIIEDPVRFPSGMAALASGLHALGLKSGLYTSATSLTCQDRPGSFMFEAQDAASYCAFGMDYLKIDDCGGTRYAQLNTSWVKFRQGLSSCSASGGPDITMSVEYCDAGMDCGWVAELADLWRCSGDVQANWASILHNLDAANANVAVQRPGHYNDPDLLVCGQPGVSLEECRSQLSAWAVVAAPLLLSLDLTSPQPPQLLSLLLNSEVMSVSQDAGRAQGLRVSAANSSGVECWARPLAPAAASAAAAGAQAELAVLLLNRGEAPSAGSCSWAELGIAAGATASVRDLWAQAALPDATGAVAVAELPAHSCRLLRLAVQ